MILRPATAEDVPALQEIAERAYSIYVDLYTRLGCHEDSRHAGDGFQRVYMSKRLR